MENNKECIELLSNTIKELYAIELIFSDFKANELDINYEDEKFIIPYENQRTYLKNILKCAYDNEKYFNRVYYMIIREAEKTLKNNSQNIDMLIAQAIKYAINMAGKKDIIVLAGKGHEPYQEINGVKHPFDERIIVNQIIKGEI